MNKILFGVILLALGSSAEAANVVTGKADFSWTLPTTSQPGNVPLTGALALTQIKAFIRTTPILDTDTMAATAVLPGTATSFSYTAVVPNGSTIYGRFQACVDPAVGTCSAYSNQASKAVLVLVPDVPTNVSVTVTVTVTTGP